MHRPWLAALALALIMPGTGLAAPTVRTGRIVGAETHVRAGGNLNYESIIQLPANTPVIVLNEAYGWYEIALPAEAQSYVATRYIDVAGRHGLVRASRLNVRARASAQATVESALRLGRPEPARHSLALLRSEGTVTSARVYGPGGAILLSAEPYEEGRRAASVWIPDAAELPPDGLVKTSEDGGSVRAFLPISIPEPAVLEVGFSMAATKAAMDRGARLGIGLMAVSLLAVGYARFIRDRPPGAG